MRNKLGDILFKLGKSDKRIYIVVADISPAGSIDNFRKKFPNRFINVGVAEQTMIGISAGLAMQNKRPFAYTIAAFSVFRPFEMIRNDLCNQNLPVTIIGMGAGTIYSTLGCTHLTQEDIGVLRAVPNINIFSPCDALELEEIIKFCIKFSKGPSYVRIGKSGENIYTQHVKKKWQFAKIRRLERGEDACILTHGILVKLAYQVRSSYKKKKISIYSCSTLKPFDSEGLKQIFRIYKKIIVIEDHSLIGGLYDIVRGLAFEYHYLGKIINSSLKDEFIHNYGTHEDLLNQHGVSLKKILKKLK
jgi:transketolase